jgi:hypothetical protein
MYMQCTFQTRELVLGRTLNASVYHSFPSAPNAGVSRTSNDRERVVVVLFDLLSLKRCKCAPHLYCLLCLHPFSVLRDV